MFKTKCVKKKKRAAKDKKSRHTRNFYITGTNKAQGQRVRTGVREEARWSSAILRHSGLP